MNSKKIYALYLPQYHEIPENNQWWGKGYTEWNAVKKGKSFFQGHDQPKEPLDDRYYDLSDETGETWNWQAETARKYGVDGFCIYHYWFKDGKKLLEKPMEILLQHKDINIEYFVCWANEPWKRTWYQNNGQLLMPQEYGKETEWEEHYNYLRKFFNDERYVKISGCPVVAIYKTADIDELHQMKDMWNKLARKDGFNGIYLLGAKTAFEQEYRNNIVDGEYLFEPGYTMHYQYNWLINMKRGIRKIYGRLHNRIFKKKVIENLENINDLYNSFSIPREYKGKDIYYGICPSWDNTPRKQEKGCVFLNSSPSLFKKKLEMMLNDSNAGDFIMINAWNEWGEGAYLEPDKKNEYAYLQAIKDAKKQ